MSDRNHPIWKLAAIVVIGGMGLAFCELAYVNGVNVLKDGTLITLVAALTAAATKYLGAEK